METLITGLVPVVAVIVAIAAVAFLYEVGRRVWYWAGSKMYGWSKEERFERETAWIDREAARNQQIAERDDATSKDTSRRRIGVNIAAFAIFALALQLDLPWWNAALIFGGTVVGLTMASGLSFKW